jgi:hypothetical protein
MSNNAVAHPVEGAGIKCHVCGARPFAADWGLPESLETYDLRKNGDRWECPQHRTPRPKRETRNKPDALLDKLTDVVSGMGVQFIRNTAEVDEEEQAEALELIDRIRESMNGPRRDRFTEEAAHAANGEGEKQ